MVNPISEKTVNRYWKYNRLLTKFGLKTGLICGYGEGFLERLRNTYYGGMPASILLLNPKSCRGKCYDRAVLACFAFKDMEYRVVHANIDSIRYNRKTVEQVNAYLAQGLTVNERYPNHCFVEVNLDGRIWVIDTTDALIYDKRLYYLINRPVINRVNSKEETINFIEYQDIENADFDKDKWFLPNLLPLIESQIEESSMYKELAQKEIQLFKDTIHFDELCAEYHRQKKEHLDAAKLKREFCSK